VKQKIALIFAVFAMLAGASVLSAQSPQSLTMTNAEVVSVDPSQRIMVIRNTQGKNQTVELDDQLAGFGGIRPGDKVVLSLRKGPGRDRVTSISKGGAPAPASGSRVDTSPAGAATTKEPAAANAAASTAEVPASQASVNAYSDRVATLAQQANEVDRLWGEFRNVCNVSVDAHYDSREWVSLWDKQARVDLSSGSCRDLYNQILTAGETVNAGMAGAGESAKKGGLVDGDLRGIRQRYSMDWEGWGRTPPERLPQP
jgi:hypothetical protein